MPGIAPRASKRGKKQLLLRTRNRVVNLLVTSERAEQLSLASYQTTIQLALRNPLDRSVTKTRGFVPPLPADVPLWPSGTFLALPALPKTSPVASPPA